MSTSGVEGTQQEREKKSLDEEYIGIIIGALAALILLLFLVIIIIIVRQRQKKANNNHQALIKTAIVPRHVTLDLNDLQANGANGKNCEYLSAQKYPRPLIYTQHSL